MVMDAYLYTNRGGRGENEDCADYRIEDGCGLFAVADGLGGHRGGAEASALCVRTLMAAPVCPAPPEAGPGEASAESAPAADLGEALLRANEALLAARGGKSTAVVLRLADGVAAWAHVGDSRLYCVTGGRLVHATQDHSVTFKKFLAGEIRRREMNFDEDRSSLLRVLGDKDRCIPETGSVPGSFGEGVSPGDAFLLCTDGFWEYLYDEEILADCLKADTARDWAELMLLRLLPRMGAGSDNLTLLAVFTG